MSDIRMSDWFNLPTTPGKFWLAPVERDNGDRRQGQMIALVQAINTHDTMQARINELAKAILETLDDHGDLADGDVCTLIKLKRVVGL